MSIFVCSRLLYGLEVQLCTVTQEKKKTLKSREISEEMFEAASRVI